MIPARLLGSPDAKPCAFFSGDEALSVGSAVLLSDPHPCGVEGAGEVVDINRVADLHVRQGEYPAARGFAWWDWYALINAGHKHLFAGWRPHVTNTYHGYAHLPVEQVRAASGVGAATTSLPPRNHLLLEVVAAGGHGRRGLQRPLPPQPPTSLRGELENRSTGWIYRKRGKGEYVRREVVAVVSGGSKKRCNPHRLWAAALTTSGGSPPGLGRGEVA